MFLHVSVILLTGGIPGQVHPLAGTPHLAGTPWAGTPPGRYTSLARYNPRAGTPPSRYTPHHSACWDTVSKRAVRILMECILVSNFFLI